MTRLEGDIQRLRDTALLCWGKILGGSAQGFEREKSRVGLGNEGSRRVPPSGPKIASDEIFTPYITTLAPQDVPIAMVSRSAYRSADKSNVNVPQNEAWLSLIRNPERSVLIQNPDLNTVPVTKSIVDALARGIEGTVSLRFGYTAAGEMIPGEAETNEKATKRLIAMMTADGPALVDDCVGVQEVNVMVDSPLICRVWRERLERNQNARQFGVAEDGIWREGDGSPGERYRRDPGMLEGLVWGAGGMLKKLRVSGGLGRGQ
ncbi:uncharacterized protein J7T54_006620 [Emericellopsis cladophorae]|uniref:Uncharacterized protein n=1 Tax=Emericellopsis cladophorae TaxID=2686198 RepID=A0A9P9Y7U0_9HYPO|nr:uncharacterized protein J7T54_006620 [Emericellopsis cladophorae]KAI6784575.1 hypothetical protein J7T54_006620 [Emericellopsis cladophorae]